MKTRLATPVATLVELIFPDGSRKVVAEFDTLDTDYVIKTVSWDEMKRKHGKLLAIGFPYKYDTPSGRLEPGCLYWDGKTGGDFFWDNHEGPLLWAILPNGDPWCIDGRANNCDMPNDRLHRCWCRHGEVPNITVDNNGLTCTAGAGSIQSGDYHGYLTNGEFNP